MDERVDFFFIITITGVLTIGVLQLYDLAADQ